MVDGILFSSDLAAKWEDFASRAAGESAERLVARLSELFTPKEVMILGAYFGANALRAFSRALGSCACDEPTDPDVADEVTDPYITAARMVPPWGPIDDEG